MQKVITITAHIGIPDDKFKEEQYPELTKILEQGYFVKETIPIKIDNSNSYSITFVLQKNSSPSGG
jgi:hypothetical protein